jgi:hypothetical protein
MDVSVYQEVCLRDDFQSLILHLWKPTSTASEERGSSLPSLHMKEMET